MSLLDQDNFQCFVFDHLIIFSKQSHSNLTKKLISKTELFESESFKSLPN